MSLRLQFLYNVGIFSNGIDFRLCMFKSVGSAIDSHGQFEQIFDKYNIPEAPEKTSRTTYGWFVVRIIIMFISDLLTIFTSTFTWYKLY